MARSKLRRKMARARKRRGKMAEKKKQRESIPDVVTLALVREVGTTKGVNPRTGERIDVKTFKRDDATAFWAVINAVPYAKEKNRKVQGTGGSLGYKLEAVREAQDEEEGVGVYTEEVTLTRDEFVHLCEMVVDEPPEGMEGVGVYFNRSVTHLKTCRRKIEEGDEEEEDSGGSEEEGKEEEGDEEEE